MAATTTSLVVEVFVRGAFVRLANALARVWVILVWVFACWWISTLAFTCVIVIVLSISTFLDITAFTFARSVIEVLVVLAGLVLGTLTATAFVIKILSRVAVVRSAIA